MKHIKITSLILYCLIAVVCFGQANTNNSSKETINLYPKPVSKISIHSYYAFEYSEENEQALWVYYHIKPEFITGNAKRKDNFRADPSISTGSATPSDYDKSGFDRGHLCPAGSMKINQKAMDESFYMSNMSPQHPALNRGKWNTLENQERNWTLKFGELIIVTGPIFCDSKIKIGKNGVTVPKAYYKIMFHNNQMIGFILPNEKCPLEISKYSVTVDSIETLTNIDFFHSLNDSIENILESKIDLQFWFN